MISSIKRFLFRETIDGRNYEVSGLEPHRDDERDYQFQDLGGIFDYRPAHSVHEVRMLSVKDQGTLNTCVWNSYAASREGQEGVTLSPRSIVQYAAKHGLLRGNGYSSIREGQEAGRSFGIASEACMPNVLTDWRTYSGDGRGLGLISTVVQDASRHRAKAYFWVNSRQEVLKALDEGRAIHTGTDWYHSYNMSGGLRAPFILPWRKGVKVGGHAFVIVGYDLPRQLLKFQNSFGPGYGDGGCFYVRFADWFAERIPGAVTVDLDEPTLAQVLASYEGHDVRSAGSPAIYRIQGGKLRPYLDPLSFHAWGGRFDEDPQGRSFDYVSSSLIDSAEPGEPMDASQSPYWGRIAPQWDAIRWLPPADAVAEIKKTIKPYV